MASEKMMTTFTVVFDEEKLRSMISGIAEREIGYSIREETLREKGAVRTWIKEVLYEHKDEIIEQVVERASKEMVRKGMNKFLEGLNK